MISTLQRPIKGSSSINAGFAAEAPLEAEVDCRSDAIPIGLEERHLQRRTCFGSSYSAGLD
jgi:hypothetical protein